MRALCPQQAKVRLATDEAPGSIRLLMQQHIHMLTRAVDLDARARLPMATWHSLKESWQVKLRQPQAT